jgi:hypothetical protein
MCDGVESRGVTIRNRERADALLALARDGDPTAPLKLAALFIRAGQPVPRPYSAAISRALRNAAHDADHGRAPRLDRRLGLASYGRGTPVSRYRMRLSQSLPRGLMLVLVRQVGLTVEQASTIAEAFLKHLPGAPDLNGESISAYWRRDWNRRAFMPSATNNALIAAICWSPLQFSHTLEIESLRRYLIAVGGTMPGLAAAVQRR